MEYWKWKAIDKLKDYEAQQTALVNLPDEITMLLAEYRGIKSSLGDSASVTGGGAKSTDDRLISNIVRRAEMAEALKRAKVSVRTVQRGLAVLDPQERRCLDLLYIHKQKDSMTRLLEELGYAEEKSVYRKTDKALRKFTIALYGITES